MTKLTNEMRQQMLFKIMKDLPSKDYIREIHRIVQTTIGEFMPKEVRALYNNDKLRGYLTTNSLEVRLGNTSVPMYASGHCDRVYGLTHRLVIRMDDAEHPSRMPEGSLYRAVVMRLSALGLVKAYFDQEALRRDVEKRIKANLASVGTIKRLYEVLEPELHHFIPKEDARSTLPACVAPVVDDLRKLGAQLPEVQKVEKVK